MNNEHHRPIQLPLKLVIKMGKIFNYCFQRAKNLNDELRMATKHLIHCLQVPGMTCAMPWNVSNLNPIFDLQRYGFVHEKPFLPGERYSVSREMERNVKGYKVIKKIIFSRYQEIAWYADMPKRPKRCNNTLTSGSSPRFDRGPRAGGSTKEGPPVDGQVRTTCWRLVAIQFTRLSYFEESLIFSNNDIPMKHCSLYHIMTSIWHVLASLPPSFCSMQ